MASKSLMGIASGEICAGQRGSVLQEIPYSYLEKRMGGAATNGSVGRTANPVNLQARPPRPVAACRAHAALLCRDVAPALRACGAWRPGREATIGKPPPDL